MRVLAEGHDVVISEVGGTVGDIESLPFLEGIRQFRQEVGPRALHVHLTLVPYIRAAGELKTKPTQHSVRELMQTGIQPAVLVCRTEHPLDDEIKAKIAGFTNVDPAGVIEALDVDTIYQVPLEFRRQQLDDFVLDQFGIEAPAPPSDLAGWTRIVERIKSPRGRTVRIAVVGKYTALVDAYKSIEQALIHGGIANDVNVEIDWISGEKLEQGLDPAFLVGYHGLLVPGGFGIRGIEGMITAIRWARENGLPFLGICLGLQCAVIEFARNVAGLAGAHSFEFDRESPHPVICLMDEQRKVTTKRRCGSVLRGQAGAGVAGGEGLGSPRSPSGNRTATRSTTTTRRAQGDRDELFRDHDRRKLVEMSSAGHPCSSAASRTRFKSVPQAPTRSSLFIERAPHGPRDGRPKRRQSGPEARCRTWNRSPHFGSVRPGGRGAQPCGRAGVARAALEAGCGVFKASSTRRTSRLGSARGPGCHATRSAARRVAETGLQC